MIGQTISHYRIIEQIGEGGMGVVYEAEDTRLGRRVAIKIPSTAPDSQDQHARFLREARSVSALSHPHIATLFDYGETPDGRPYIVMELVHGRELGDLLRNGELTLGRAVEITADVAEALCEAHRHGIIHRDIKPSNIFINERGQVKVLDFGLAKLIGKEHELDQNSAALVGLKTRSDVMLGTPLYLSPEQAKAVPVDGRSDLFGLGAVLYECIAGRAAFSGATVVEIAAQVIYVDPPPPSQYNRLVPPELDRITMKALAKQPEERYQKCEELITDLRALSFYFSEVDETRTPSFAFGALAGASRPHSLRASSFNILSDNLRRPRLSIAAVLVAVLVLVAGAWGVRRMIRPAPYQPPPEAKRAYDAGSDLLREGAYYEASKRLLRAVSLDDKYVLAHARLAEAWTELDYADRAKDSLLRVELHAEEREGLSPVDALYLDAIRATVTRQFARAVTDYQEIARQLPDRTEVYVDLGRAYEKTEEIKKAIEKYVEATNRDPKNATAYLRLGILYSRQQNRASASAAFDKAEEIYKEFGNREGQTEVHYRRGYLLRAVGKLDEARAQLQRALEMAKTTGNESQRINTLLQLSTVATNENNAVGAQSYAREAVELAQRDGMENLVALGLTDLGNTFFLQGSYAEAEKYLKQGLDFAQRYNASRYEAKALSNLGSLRIQQGDTETGTRYVEQARVFYQAGGYRKEEAQVLAILGRAKRKKGNYAEALKAFEQLLQLAEQAGDPTLVSAAHTEIGNVLARQEKYLDALRHFDESSKIDRALGIEIRAGYSLHNLSEMLWRLGRYEEARTVLAQAATIAQKPSEKNKEVLAYLYLTEANIALSENRFGEAVAKSEQSLNTAGELNKSLSTEAKLTLGLAQTFSGAAGRGKQACEEAVSTANRIGDPWLISFSQLALAQAQMESGDVAAALKNAQEVQANFARSGQQVSEWRAWLLAARASRRMENLEAARDYSARATNVLADLQQQWGADAFNVYQARPDVQLYRKQLVELSANVR
ncbi:MAG: protein kinase domain-containing protein [Pyrinomonadaceae bacterium]